MPRFGPWAVRASFGPIHFRLELDRYLISKRATPSVLYDGPVGGGFDYFPSKP